MCRASYHRDHNTNVVLKHDNHKQYILGCQQSEIMFFLNNVLCVWTEVLICIKSGEKDVISCDSIFKTNKHS